MEHPAIRFLFSSVFLLAGLFLFVDRALACSCIGDRTVLDAFNGSDNVIRVRITSIATLPKTPLTRDYLREVAEARVEQVFKGPLPANTMIRLQAGGVTSCDLGFDEKSLQEEFLLFLPAKPFRADGVWAVGLCSRSAHWQAAKADVAFLKRAGEVAGKTRVSGIAEQVINEQGPQGYETRRIPLIKHAVTIRGNGRNTTLETDENGLYEVYDLPPGKYTISSEQIPGYVYALKDGKLPFTLAAKKHVEIDLEYGMLNRIKGRLVDSQGRPMAGVDVKLFPTARLGPLDHYNSVETKADGTFEFLGSPAGSYLIGINHEALLNANAPFKPFFYPGTEQRAAATEIQLGPGTDIPNLEITAPAGNDIVSISGVLKFSDGKVATEENTQHVQIIFLGKQFSDGGRRLGSETTIDGQGRFTIKVFKGLAGTLYGEISAYLGKYIDCPEFEKIYEARVEKSGEMMTQKIPVISDRDQAGIELILPFPSCRMRKDEW